MKVQISTSVGFFSAVAVGSQWRNTLRDSIRLLSAAEKLHQGRIFSAQLTLGETMAHADSRITIHMAASLDGFIARKDGRVDWLETSDEFVAGENMDPGSVEALLKTIDCYVMGSRTYETAIGFEAQGLGWPYGDKPTFVITGRELPRTRKNVEFYSGDLTHLVDGRLRPAFRAIWFVGGSVVSTECLRLGLADEIRYSILPILIGEGIPFFANLDKDIALHLVEVKAYKSGAVELRYEVRGRALNLQTNVRPPEKVQ